MTTVALLVVGNEILDGTTTDTNSGWLCRQIGGRGSEVCGIVTVPDSSEAVRAGIEYLSSTQPSLLITLGGLGPTRDDLTIASIATYFELPVIDHPRAHAIVDRRYAELTAEGRVADQASVNAQRARLKMAEMPADAVALNNTVGAAPGMWLDHSPFPVLSLPGVPSELKYIFGIEAGPYLEKVLGVGYFRSVTVTTSTNDESELSHSLVAFDDKFSTLGIYLKSRARRFGADVRMQVTISAKGSDADDVRARVDEALHEFRALLEASDIGVEDAKYDE